MEPGDATLRLLMAEDSEDDMVLVLDALASAGMQVEIERVETREGLLAALGQGGWHAVICDHNMPALDSLSALALVREHDTELPFIIVSGLISDDLAVAAMQSGAADFVRKDSLSRLAPALARELREAAVRIELRTARESIERLAQYDSRTGLANRQNLFGYLESADTPGCLAVFLIDINRFRQVSTSLGIAAGNQVLASLAERLSTLAQGRDFVASLGADIFALVKSGIASEQQLAEVAHAIHAAVSQPMVVEQDELYLTCGIGVACQRGEWMAPEELFKRAEIALRSAKQEGRANYRVYEPEMGQAQRDRLALESGLHRALREGQFVLHYQPQYELAGGRIVGAEALLRWHHPEQGLVPPDRFIPLLEETGLIVPVGEWVLREACAQNRRWQSAGLSPIRVAVNLSAVQFRQANLAEVVSQALADTGLEPEWLELEITENVAMHNEEQTIATLKALSELGLTLAMDDFGTGYSSLGYLKRFSIDKLKIDKSFVADIVEGDKDGIVPAIIAMAHSLRLKVVAEGVETAEQAAFLQGLGCDEVQGYFYGAPVNAEALGDTLAIIEPC